MAIDFRGTGILALKGMAFFCQNYERKVNECSHFVWCVGRKVIFYVVPTTQTERLYNLFYSADVLQLALS